MRSEDDNNQWHIQLRPDYSLDFCIWVLEQVGLGFYPFEKHTTKDSSLNISDAQWWSWLLAINKYRYELESMDLSADNDMRRAYFEKVKVLADPVSFWINDALYVSSLKILFQEYISRYKKKRGDFIKLHISSVRDAILWSDFSVYHSARSHISIILVQYAEYLIYPLPHNTVLITIGSGIPTADIMRTQIRSVIYSSYQMSS